MGSSLLNESHNWNSSNSYKDQSMDFDDYDLNDQNFNESSTVTYKLSPPNDCGHQHHPDHLHNLWNFLKVPDHLL